MSRRGPSVRRWRPAGLALRLFVSQALVVVAGAVTLWTVMAAVAPPIFRSHLRRAAGQVDPVMSQHVEEAFQSATTLSTTVAVSAGLIIAALVSAYATSRIVRPVESLAEAAAEIASGRYAARVGVPGLGDEFDRLAAAFNSMAGRLEAVEGARRRLLADLAHEMRTPVATLNAYLDGLEDGIAPLDADTLDVLREQTSRLSRLAEDVTAVSHAEEHQVELHRESADPGELLGAAVAAAADRFAAKGVALTAHSADDVGTVLVDRVRIGQVLGNLLDNALRHTPAGGAVTVAARPVRRDLVALSVTDTGEGIPAEHLAHVFERFYRVDPSRDRAHGGSGIGLTIARSLAEAHGGRVTVSSAGEGAGTTFTVLLPVHAADANR
jgi:signal transduction histidine kinase